MGEIALGQRVRVSIRNPETGLEVDFYEGTVRGIRGRGDELLVADDALFGAWQVRGDVSALSEGIGRKD